MLFAARYLYAIFRQIYKKTYIYLLFCENVTATRGNTLQLLQNQANLIKNKK